MPEITATEVAEIKRFYQVYHWLEYNRNKRPYGVSDADIQTLKTAASILRRVASGELAPLIHAHWEADEFGRKCSHCGEYPTDEQYENGDTTYCPSCGALMDGKDDEDAEVH